MNTKHRGLRWALAVPAALLLVALAATLVMGAETRLLDGKLRTGDTVTVPASETVSGDLYVFAGTVQVDGNVDGDLTVFAGTLTLNGDVSGDVNVGAGTVTIAGTIEGDLRSGSGQLNVSGPVGEDAVISGGQVTVGGDIGGDLIASGGTITLSGNVAGNVEGTAGTYSRSGTVSGSDNMRIGQGDGNVPQPQTTGDRILDAVRHFVVLVVLGALLLLLWPRALRRPEETLRAQPLLSLGGGFLAWIGFIAFVIVVILVAVLLAIVLGLLSLGALAAIDIIAALLGLFLGSFGFWIAVAFLADLVVGFALSRLVVRDTSATASRWTELGLLIAGAAVVVIVTSLPVIGGLAKLAVMLFGLGAIAIAAWRRWRSPMAPATVSAPPAATPPEAPAAV
ncbi:MAG TPA: hypothetical protein VFK61_02240 [Candidatus Limnocylindria bacterium]|nr:hypothetical protein [Candidatus Limnocylindria bacterium]